MLRWYAENEDDFEITFRLVYSKEMSFSGIGIVEVPLMTMMSGGDIYISFSRGNTAYNMVSPNVTVPEHTVQIPTSTHIPRVIQY